MLLSPFGNLSHTSILYYDYDCKLYYFKIIVIEESNEQES
jgi:hypothetical protein